MTRLWHALTILLSSALLAACAPVAAAQGGRIVDEQTGSTWSLLGQASDGELAGTTLTPLPHADYFWFAWAAFHPETRIYTP